MSKTQILQQHARCILGHSNRSCFFRSYETLPAANQTLPSQKETNNLDQKAQIISVLESWRTQGHQVKPSDLRNLIKNLHDSNQFSKALEASEWMGEQRVFDIFPEDYAARLHLVENVLGLEEAEKFFKSIPENMRDYSVYVALLSSYTKSETTLDKAEATFDKMRELGFLMKPSPFNSMISLYGKLQNQDMVEKLVHEMQETKVECDIPTVNNVLKVYADTCNIKAMETFKTWVEEQGIKLEKGTIVAMAKAYHTSGLIQKAIEMYGNVAGSEREVYRLWNEYKMEAKVDDDGYRSMIRSLLKLNDVEGAEKIYGEWKPEGPKLDISIPGLLISRYYAEGMVLKVEQMVESIEKKRYEMHLKKSKERLSFSKVNVGTGLKVEEMESSRMKSYGMYLENKEILIMVGLVVGILTLLLVSVLLDGLEIAWHDWFIEQHPPSSYWEVQLLKDNPLFILWYVRK